jgi:hypothetical protein
MGRSDNTERAVVAPALVDLLLGGEARSQQAAERIAAAGGWRLAAGLAEDRHVLPTFGERIKMVLGDARPDVTVESIARAKTALSAMRSAAALRSAENVMRELADAGIRSVAIKGVAVIATLYGSSSRRMVSDVDIVIRPEDLAAARATLAARGYEDRSPPFERHVAAIALSRTLHNFARTFVRDGFEIDLHWQFGPRPPAELSTDRLLDNAVTTEIEERTLCVAGPIETALLLVHHALRGAFAASSTVKDLVDLSAWWTRHGSARGEELVGAASDSGLGSSLLALLSALSVRDPDLGCETAIAELETTLGDPGRTEAAMLVAFFDDVVRGDEPDSATVQLFAPKIYARSIIGPVYRELTWKAAGSTPPPNDVTASTKPIAVRALRRLTRGWRIARELTNLKRIRAYRAVAKAQSHFH